MSDIEYRFDLKRKEFLGEKDLLSLAIAAPSEVGIPHELDAVTMFVFDGPHFEGLNLAKHVEVEMVWLDYGKLHLEPQQGKLTQDVERLSEHFWQVVHRRLDRGTGRHLRSAGGVVPVAKAGLNFFGLEPLLEALQVFQGRRSLVRGSNSQFTRQDCRLQFYDDSGYVSAPFGDVTYRVEFHRPRSVGLGRSYLEIQNEFGLNVDDSLRALERGFQPERYPHVIVHTTYAIPASVVTDVLRLGERAYPDDEFTGPKLVLYTNIVGKPVQAGNMGSGYRVIGLTQVKGEKEPAIFPMDLPDPLWSRVVEAKRVR